MKKIAFFSLFFLFSCADIVQKPKTLLPEEEMAHLIAEFAVSDQTQTVMMGMNMENATRYILRKNKTKGEDFYKSYQYYFAHPDKMETIFDMAQKNILKMDPNAKEYIDKKNTQINQPSKP